MKLLLFIVCLTCFMFSTKKLDAQFWIGENTFRTSYFSKAICAHTHNKFFTYDKMYFPFILGKNSDKNDNAVMLRRMFVESIINNKQPLPKLGVEVVY